MIDKLNLANQQIQNAFPVTAAPFKEWEHCRSVEDFVQHFGNDFFCDFWPYMYDDLNVTRFLFPFLLQYYLMFSSESSSSSIDYFIGTLDLNLQREVQKDTVFEEFSSSLNNEQKDAVCQWLKTMQGLHLGLNVERPLNYWCRQE